MKKNTAAKLLKKVKSDYSRISDEFDQTRKSKWHEFDTFSKFIENEGNLVDLGCGNGRFFDYLKKNKLKLNYIGIDNNKQLVQKAKKNQNAKFIEGDLLKIPLPNNSQDTIVSIAALHHIPSKTLRIKAVKEMARILKKNGKLIITVWNLFQPKYKKYIWISYIRHLLSFGKYDSRDTFIPWGKTGVKRYYYAFKEDELKKLLGKQFEVLETHSGRNQLFICKKR